MTGHINADALGAYAAGKLADDGCVAIETHVGGCDACGETLDRLSVHGALLDRLRRLGPIVTADTPTQLLERLKLARPKVDELLQRGRLGQYQLVARLGAGGMGTVYEALHPVMKRSVAIKILPRAFATGGALERFHREIALLAKLDHPHIVRAYDAGADDGIPYLVMEIVRGADLHRHVVKHGPLPIDVACRVLRQAALGLAHAHEHRLVHRDIKPSNLLLSDDGSVVKISDLGLVRAEQIALEESTLAHLTGEGLVMGTPDFLAPEQWQDARQADIRADLYSLGCTFYYLVTGQPPYPGGTYTDKMTRHCAGQPTPLERLRPDVPPAIVAVVRKLMARQPEDRFQTPAALIVALDAALREPPRRAAWWASPGGRWTIALGAVAAVLLVVALGVNGMRRPRDGDPAPSQGPGVQGAPQNPVAPPVPRPEASKKNEVKSPAEVKAPAVVVPRPAPAPNTTVVAAGEPELIKVLKGHTGEVSWVAFDPQGHSFASAGFDNTVRIWSLTSDQAVATLRHKGKVQSIAYSPDGKTLASCTDDEGLTRLWDVETGKDTILGRNEGPFPKLRSVSFRSDGRVVAASIGGPVAQESVKLWDVVNKKAAGRLGPPGDRGYSSVYAVAFCPDTNLLAAGYNSLQRGVRLWDTTKQEELEFLPGPSVALAFAPDGRKLAIAEGQEVAVWNVEPQKGTVLRHASYQMPMTRFGDFGFACCVAFAPDRRTLAAAFHNGTVALWNTDTGDLLTAFRAHDLKVRGGVVWYRECSVAFSPDGQTLLTGGFDHAVKLWKLPTAPR